MARSSKVGLVFGVGKSDADYRITITKKSSGVIISSWRCPIYQLWTNMLMRCYSEVYLLRNPSYRGCSVTRCWLSFMNFREWVIASEWNGSSHLDKDLLEEGNRVYHPEKCIFVDPALNNFLCDHRAARGPWPLGVYWNKRDRLFYSRCCNPFTGKAEGVGYFKCPDEAHLAWKRRKHELATRYALMQEDKRLSKALISRYSFCEDK